MKQLIFAFIIAVLTFSYSCSGQPDEPSEDKNARSEELGLKLMSIWESGDTLLLDEIFHENGEYADMANNHIFKGIQEAKSYIGHVHNWGSNIQMDIRDTKFTEDYGVIEWTFTAIQSSPIKGRVPVATNKDVTIHGVTLIEVVEGQIVKSTDYLDALGFVIQLGSRIELPGGVVIGG